MPHLLRLAHHSRCCCHATQSRHVGRFVAMARDHESKKGPSVGQAGRGEQGRMCLQAHSARCDELPAATHLEASYCDCMALE